MPKGKYTMADVDTETPASPIGKYTAADIDSATPHTSIPQLQQGFFSSAADSSGLSGLAHAVAHPKDTVMGIPAAVKGAYHQTADNLGQAVTDAKSGNYAGAVSHGVSAIPILGPTLDKATDQYAGKNYAGEMGTLTGLAAGTVAPAALKTLPGALRVAGEVGQDTGAGVLNKTAGMLKADFKRGANGGRAYLDAGGGPAMSMQGLADQAAALKGGVGKRLGAARNAATNAGVVASPEQVASALNPAINKGIDLETGAGGAGNTGSIENYSASFRPTLKTGIANGGITPNELSELKGRIADNTNWSDPSQFNLKSIRQQNVGALSGLENDTVPEVAPLKTQFQGLGKFAARTADRASTGSSPFTSLMAKGLSTGLGALGGAAMHNPELALGAGLTGLAATSIPVQSALASGLYYGGRGLGAAGRIAVPLEGLPMKAIAPYNLLANKQKKEEE